MIDDCNINNLTKNEISAVFHSRAVYISQKCITQIYRALYGNAMFVPFGGTQNGGRKPTETSVTEFCYKSANLSLEELKNNTVLLSLMQELFRWPNSSK